LFHLQRFVHFFLSKCTTTSTTESSSRELHSTGLPNFPLQQAKRSLTLQGTTHANPNNPKIEFHKALANSQWSKRWPTVSTLFLHKQHQSITMICCFLTLSKERILLKAAFQVGEKKGALLHQIHHQVELYLSPA